MAPPTTSQREDNHVHSVFSDGKGTIAENIAAAEARGLQRLTCVDHVRADTAWAPEFVAAVRAADQETEIELRCGLEAKLLDTEGNLDIPSDLGGADYIYAADHQVPLASGPTHPREVKAAIESGEMKALDVLEAIVTATANAVDRHENVVIAHLFSVLPKIGLAESQVPGELVAGLAEVAARRGARIEIDERWSCPAAATLAPFLELQVPILLSTDSHRPEAIGRYDYCLGVLDELGLAPM
jgi:putative hydrolase